MIKNILVAAIGFLSFVSAANAQIGHPVNVAAMNDLANTLSRSSYYGVTPRGTPCRVEAGRIFLPNGFPFGPIRVAGYDAAYSTAITGYFELGPDPRVHSVIGYWSRPNGLEITVRSIGFSPIEGYRQWTGTLTIGRNAFGQPTYITLAESAYSSALGTVWTRQFACGQY